MVTAWLCRLAQPMTSADLPVGAFHLYLIPAYTRRTRNAARRVGPHARHMDLRVILPSP